MVGMDFRPSALNWVTVGVMAITFIVLAKFLVNKYPNPVTDKLRSVINIV